MFVFAVGIRLIWVRMADVYGLMSFRMEGIDHDFMYPTRSCYCSAAIHSEQSRLLVKIMVDSSGGMSVLTGSTSVGMRTFIFNIFQPNKSGNSYAATHQILL